LDVFYFRENVKVAKSHSLYVYTMYYGVPDEGGLGYYAMHNQEVSRSDSDSVAEDSTPCSRQGGPRLDEHGK
jgi:hypothetical protein